MPPKGYKFSEESKARLSAAKKGQKYSPEARARMSAAQMGKKLSPETKAKISVSLKGKPKPEGFGERVSAIHTGAVRSLQSVERLSAASMGKKYAAGHIVSEEARLELAKSHRQYVKCCINGKFYDSLALAAADLAHTGIRYKSLCRICRKYPEKLSVYGLHLDWIEDK